MSFPIFSAIKEGLTSLKTGIDSLKDATDSVATVISGLSLSQTNNTSVIFSGAAIYDQTISSASLYVVADDKIVVSGTAVCRNTTDNAVEVTDFTMVNGDSDIIIYNNTERVKLRFTLGSIQVFRDIGPDPIQVTLLFYTQPAMGTGIVGPIGPSGTELEIGNWTNLSYGSGWSDYHINYYSGQYRIFHDMVQIRGLITSSSWSGQSTIATLPANARPLRRVTTIQPCQSEATCRIQLYPDGTLVYISGGAGNSWIGLDNIQFSLS